MVTRNKRTNSLIIMMTMMMTMMWILVVVPIIDMDGKVNNVFNNETTEKTKLFLVYFTKARIMLLLPR